MAPVMGHKTLWALVVLMSFIGPSLQASSPQSDSYVAAVVEYAAVSGATLENKDEIFMRNVAKYECFMQEAARQGADIIVFPETGLASMGVPRNPDGTPSLAFYVPEPETNPCDNTGSDIAQGLRELSCAARRHKLYVVVNLPERVNCTGCPCPGFPVTADGEQCPPSGAYYHNTNVAFDRNGNIVARYRKFNLFGEAGFVPTPEPEYAIFETDFGVRFGTFICFDIMFEKPAALLATRHDVCDFAFVATWFSEAPFLTAVQTQAAWAYSLDVNLLASGYNKPEVGSAGSGIFLGRRGALQSVMPNSTTSRLLVGTVPKMQRCKGASDSTSRSRRSSVDVKSAADRPEGEDDDTFTGERTPLSAFHHIVRQRKYGHLEMDDEERTAEGGADQDDDDSQPPSGEYESKVPPHFMGLQRVDQVEDDGPEAYETAAKEARGGAEGSEKEDNEEISQSRPLHRDEKEVGFPEKKIPATTRTDDEYGFSEPSKNPDLLQLYQEDPEEQQLPEEFLEIEVPEAYERSFEPERDHEYFKLPDGEEITMPREEEKGRNEQLLSTDIGNAATGGESDDSDVSFEQGEKGIEQAEEAADSEPVGTSEGERNATQEEIEASLKKFQWLMEPEVPPAPCAGEKGEAEQVSVEENHDDTDDVLTDDHGVHLLDDSEQSDTSPEQEAEDTGELIKPCEEDNLARSEQPAESQGESKKHRKCRRGCRRDRAKRNKRKCKPRTTEQELEEKSSPEEPEEVTTKPVEQHVDETDDVLADDHGIHLLDANENADISPEEEANDTGEPIEPSEADTSATTEQPQGESKKPRICCPKGTKHGCKPKPKEQQLDEESSPEEPKRQHARCDRNRPRRESGCPAFQDGVPDDGTDSTSTAGLFLKRDYLEVYRTFPLTTDSRIENSTLILCDGTFCCNFSVVMEVDVTYGQPRYAYRFAVFNGVRSFDGVATGGVQVCGVIPCSRDDLDSCGMLTLPDAAAHATVFRSISVSGVFSTNHTLVAANTVVPGLSVLPADKFEFSSLPLADDVARVSLRTTAAVVEEGAALFTFAIYSRVFQRDGQPATTLPGAAAGVGT